MRMTFTIVSSDGGILPPGSTLNVELRDTGFADGPATVLQQLRMVVPEDARSIPVTMEVSEPSQDITVWAHVDTDATGRLSAGDYVTMQSYPLRAGGDPAMQLQVRRIE